MRVLVVDDNQDYRVLLRYSLPAGSPFSIVGEAQDAAEGIRLAASLEPDVVLLDLSMPGTDGIEALAELRACLPAATLVVLSGFAADRFAEQARARGADLYMEKGASTQELWTRLQDLLIQDDLG